MQPPFCSKIVKPFCLLIVFSVVSTLFFACGNSGKPNEKDVVKAPDQLEIRITENLRKLLDYAVEKKGKFSNSVKLSSPKLVKSVYQQHDYKVIWSHKDNFKDIADSLYKMLEHAKEYGLFPADYNYSSITSIKKEIQQDSVSRRDAVIWARADILLTEAYLKMARHLKLGRLQKDSITLKADSVFDDQYFIRHFNSAITNKSIIQSLQNLEPAYPGYRRIRENIRSFLDSANFKATTYITYPYKDTVLFLKALQKRLGEIGYLPKAAQTGDSIKIAKAILKYQKDKNLKQSGKVSDPLIRSLNHTDLDKFKSIAVTMDGYKMLPDTVPASYLIVNIPSFTLYVYNRNMIELESKVIVGSPETRTPLLNSNISEFITYPQWTVPYSIVFRDMLPKIQRNISYLDKQNLIVVDRYDSVLNPNMIKWSSLSEKRFPYLLRQRQGDDNSLGVIKFNFENKYSVYLHDTNARWLFSKSNRALSHGCVRVQDWGKLYEYLVRSDTVNFPPDTLKAWINRQEKHIVTGFPKVPLFIRYFTVEGKDGKIKFYNDFYGDDRIAKEKYFARKKI